MNSLNKFIKLMRWVMAKKFIDVMDTTFRDGFQSVYGARVLMNDF